MEYSALDIIYSFGIVDPHTPLIHTHGRGENVKYILHTCSTKQKTCICSVSSGGTALVSATPGPRFVSRLCFFVHVHVVVDLVFGPI